MKPVKSFYPWLFSLLAVLPLLAGCSAPVQVTVTAPAAPPPWPGEQWPVSKPEEQGLDPVRLSALLARIEEQRLDLHSLLVVRNGYLVLERYYQGYGPSDLHVLYSVTKSFTGTLAGIAIDRGLVEGVGQPLSDFLPLQGSANPDERKTALTLENVLTMQAGLEWEESLPAFQEIDFSPGWLADMLDRPLVEDPGTRFHYCTGCSHLLAAALDQAVGGDLAAFAQQNLFAPLGITGYSWEADPHGIPIGGWGLELTPQDMAKLGYLYLHEGLWDGRQVVSAGWVAAATSLHAGYNDGMGYGYHWWVYPSLHAFAAFGLGGQMVFVHPEQALVVVFTAGSASHDELMELIEDHILAGLGS